MLTSLNIDNGLLVLLSRDCNKVNGELFFKICVAKIAFEILNDTCNIPCRQRSLFVLGSEGEETSA